MDLLVFATPALFLDGFARIHESLSRFPTLIRRSILLLAYQAQLAQGLPDEPAVTRSALEAAGERHSSPDANADRHVIAGRLTPMGRASYEAAEITLQAFEQADARWKDAGMVSLGFFRILEVELNERLIRPIVAVVSVAQMKAAFLSMEPQRQRSWELTMKPLYAFAEKGQAPELGTLAVLLPRLAHGTKESDAVLRELLSEPLRAELTDHGRRQFADGVLDALISQDAIDRYRNPPAHARFLPLSVAAECKRHVDRSLRLLIEMVQSAT